jgi:hypothetical protein
MTTPEEGTGTYAVWAYPILSIEPLRFGPPQLLHQESHLNPARRLAQRAVTSAQAVPTNVVEVRSPDGRLKTRYWHAEENERAWDKVNLRFVHRPILRPRIYRGSISRHMETL